MYQTNVQPSSSMDSSPVASTFLQEHGRCVHLFGLWVSHGFGLWPRMVSSRVGANHSDGHILGPDDKYGLFPHPVRPVVRA